MHELPDSRRMTYRCESTFVRIQFVNAIVCVKHAGLRCSWSSPSGSLPNKINRWFGRKSWEQWQKTSELFDTWCFHAHLHTSACLPPSWEETNKSAYSNTEWRKPQQKTRRDLVIWTSGQSGTKDGWECMSAAVRIQLWLQLWDCNYETAIVRVQVRECNCETTVASAKWESAEHSANIAGLGWYPMAATQNDWKHKLFTNYQYTMLHWSFPRSATALANATSTGAPAWMTLLPCWYKKTLRKLKENYILIGFRMGCRQ